MLCQQVASAGQPNARGPALDCARKLLAEAASRVCDAKSAGSLPWADDKDRTIADQVRLVKKSV